jgi:hypothetical protein
VRCVSPAPGTHADGGARSRSAMPTTAQRKRADARTVALRAELKEMLRQPLLASGVSARYITSGTTPLVDDIISGQSASLRPCAWIWDASADGELCWQTTRRCWA